MGERDCSCKDCEAETAKSSKKVVPDSGLELDLQKLYITKGERSIADQGLIKDDERELKVGNGSID